MFAILSTSLILEDGNFEVSTLNLDQAWAWVRERNPTNFCGHETVRVLGLEPAKTRETCPGYTEALCLSPRGRLEFGREYSVEEILRIGVNFRLIRKLPPPPPDHTAHLRGDEGISWAEQEAHWKS